MDESDTVAGDRIDPLDRDEGRQRDVRARTITKAKLEALNDMFALRDFVDEDDTDLTFDADEFASAALDAE